MGRVKRKCVFEHAQNVQIQIILSCAKYIIQGPVVQS